LRALNFAGGVSFCGYGEPLLHPRLDELVKAFAGIRQEIVTSGDGLTVERIVSLAAAGMGFFVVSLYDGPHQVEDFRARFAAAGVGAFILRDRWHTDADDFGLKLTNRAGAVSVGNQDEIDAGRPCGYPAYEMLVDWNGDVLLCPQDWSKKVKFGNLGMQTILEVWTSRAMGKRRRQLMRGRAGLSPCSSCNVAGDLHGCNHIAAWKT
ncbi:SPASM domain-containing protein, partial [Nostoc sp. NIES-2111]